MRGDLVLLTLDAGRAFTDAVGAALGTPPGAHEERTFEDGEHKCRPLVSVRGRDAYVVHSLYADAEYSADEKLTRLLFFIGALKDAAAASVTAVVPYLAYSRKDRKSKPRDPVTTRYVAALFEAVGTDAVVTIDVHNLSAFQNAFRCRTEHLEAGGLLARHFAQRVGDAPLAVVSPDAGGMKRAEDFRRRLERLVGRPVAPAIAEKHRISGTVSGEALVGDVEGRVAIIVDDMISAGTTMARAAAACRARGATTVYAAATHGLFAGDANATLAAAPIDAIVTTDTVAPWRVQPPLQAKVLTLSVAPLFARAIRCLHDGGSIVDLLEET